MDSDLINWETSYPVKASLAAIARDAIIICSHQEREHLKICNDKGCQMLFKDASPNNHRRWCSMSICGNRSKVSQHREQKKSLMT
jgi:predicted RNA-binding Zn ribbon-like protein